jgi:hypothetical protein
MAEDLKITVNGRERNPGCEAVVHDDDKPYHLSVPVWMGGSAIIGCNNYEQCGPLEAKRTDPSTVFFPSFNEGGRVISGNNISRSPLRDPGSAV